jgi:hypothetical protein
MTGTIVLFLVVTTIVQPLSIVSFIPLSRPIAREFVPRTESKSVPIRANHLLISSSSLDRIIPI